MTRFLKFLLTGDWHLHNWEVFEQSYLCSSDGSRSGVLYVQKCRECGKIKFVKFKNN